MTHVISLAGRRAGAAAASPTPRNSIPITAIATVDRQAAIENALQMALYFLRQPGDSQANLWAATARTARALTLLKAAGEAAPDCGRA